MNSTKFSLASRLFAVVAAFCLSLQLSAVNKLYIEPFSVESYDEITVPVMLDLEENTGAQAFQFDVVLPEQLMLSKTPTKNSERLTAAHSLQFRESDNHLMVVSMNMAAIKGTTGPVVYLYVKAKDGALPELAEGRIELVNAKVVKPGEGIYDTAQPLDLEVEGATVTMQTARVWASFSQTELMVNPDGTARLDVAVNNSFNVRDFQIDLSMPAGFTIDGDISISDRCNPNLMVMPYDNGTFFRLIGTTMSTAPAFYGNDGVVFSLNVKVPADYAAADGEIVLYNAQFTNDAAQVFSAPAGMERSVVKLVNGGIAYNNALVEIKALEDALAAALEEIATAAPDVKDDFTGAEITTNISALTAAVEAANADNSLTGNYDAVMAPAEGIRADIAKLVEDAKAAQKAHEDEIAAEAAREEAYTNANAEVKALEDALAAALEEIATAAPDVKDDFTGEAVSGKIDGMKGAIEAAYADKTIADNYDSLVAPAEGISADIAKLVEDAKAAQKAHEDEVAAEAAREEAYTNANAEVKALEDALAAALEEIATAAPDVKDNYTGEAVSGKIDGMKGAIEAAYADKTIADNYDSLVAPAEGINADITKLVEDAKAAQLAFEADARLQTAYENAKAKLAELENALNEALETIAEQSPDVKDEFTGDAISHAITDLRLSVVEDYVDKTLADTYDEVMAPADGIAADIEALVAAAHEAQLAYEAEMARQAANKAAYDADIEAIDAMEANVDAKLAEIGLQYPDFDSSAAEAEIRAAIEAEREKAADALEAVATEGEYANTVDTETVDALLAELVAAAGVEVVSADAVSGDVKCYSLTGLRLARPAVGQVNILVHSNGTVQKVLVK